MLLKRCSSPATFTTTVIFLCPTDTVLSLDVFKRGFLFVSCAKVSKHVYTIQPLCRQRAETEAEKQKTMTVTFDTCLSRGNRNQKTSWLWHFLCCAFRTGQFVCGRWTEVTCAVWPGAPATPTLLAPSPAPGNIPAATHGLSSQAWTQRHMGLRVRFCVCLCPGWKRHSSCRAVRTALWRCGTCRLTWPQQGQTSTSWPPAPLRRLMTRCRHRKKERNKGR